MLNINTKVMQNNKKHNDIIIKNCRMHILSATINILSVSKQTTKFHKTTNKYL